MEVYDAGAVSVIVGGIPIDREAFGQGDAVKIAPSGPTYKIRKGIGGGASRARLYPHTEITLLIRQTSTGNDALSAILTADKAVSGGVGIIPVVIKDRNGKHTLVETQGFIEGEPEVAYGEEEGDLEWKIICPDPTQFVGGH